ncbi:SagB family peptide dehydrogenase [Virgisporangium aurantiacum]|uniref:Streptolysin associated protein SagB n=1 Tax=Virgisporangium aurantiacum TaxID=175570 RepID=A0A8J4E723_9ACTN|nr:SagB family peptide dehydrogenase [Virgisporangium aurantiacum]GIJ63834.1 streptolysin associated protein SagB [Virgisporangium aurantiacum]
MFDNGEAAASLAINSYRTVSPGPASIGVRTAGLKLESLDDRGVSRLAEEFLLASRVSRWDAEMAISVAEFFADPMVESYGKLDADNQVEGDVIQLPKSVPANLPVDAAIQRRRSVRYFSGDPLSLEQLSALLRNAAGVTARAEVPKSDGTTVTYWYRAAPSAGGLYPVQLLVAALNVSQLPRGLYRYSPRRDSLVTYSGADHVDRLMASLSGDDEFRAGAQNAGAFLCMVASPWRSMRKYGPRGLRFVFQEAGGIAENVHLTATALGLGSMDNSSYYDAEANRAIDCDGTLRTIIHMLILGVPAEG